MFETYKKLIQFKQQVTTLHQTEHINAQFESTKSVIKVWFSSDGSDVVIYHANGAVNNSYTVDATGYSMYLSTLDSTYATSMTLKPFETLILYK